MSNIQNNRIAHHEDIKESLHSSGFLSVPDLMEEFRRRKILYEQIFALKKQSKNFDIKEYGIDEEILAVEEQEALHKMRKFALDVSQEYQTQMHQLMEEYHTVNPKFSDKIIRRIKETHHDIPSFSLFDHDQGSKFLEAHTYWDPSRYEVGDFLMVFNLPKPLGKFWYKGGDGKLAEEVAPGEIEWGHFYRECMPVVYEGVDSALAQGLQLFRLNSYSDHEPDSYYYIWSVYSDAE